MASAMSYDFALKAANWLNRTAIRLSGGRLGWSHQGTPIIEMTTTGRRSGQPRSTLLSVVVSQGEAKVVIGSRGGGPNHPAWYLNIRDNPTVTVRNRDGSQQMAARLATGSERADLWCQIAATGDHYVKFQSKTDRQFPIVILEPVEE